MSFCWFCHALAHICIMNFQEHCEISLKISWHFVVCGLEVTCLIDKCWVQTYAYYEPSHEKTGLLPYANCKDADQYKHPGSLINIFVVHYLDSIIPSVAMSKISTVLLVLWLRKQVGLSLTWSKCSEDRFSHDMAQLLTTALLE